MLEKLQRAIVSKLKQRSFDDDEEAYCFLMSFAANFFVLAAHLLLLCIFLLFGARADKSDNNYSELFVYVNLFSIIFYSMCFMLIHNRKYLAYGLCLSFEVCLYAVLFCVLAGIQTYIVTYLVLVIIMQAMVPYGKSRIRLLVITFTVFLIIGCVITSYFVTPTIVFVDWFEKFMLAVNIFLFLTGTIALLFIGNPMSKVIKNFNEAKIMELSNQSFTDDLTGLYNRRYARKYFEECRICERTYCLAMLDIDDFKVINDTYGHACGDEILKFLSNFIIKNLRCTDVVVRWGGEEFLVILAGINLTNAYDIMEELRKNLALETIFTKEKDLKITVTIGIVQLTGDVDKSINDCDQKMYEGKRSGKNVVIM